MQIPVLGMDPSLRHWGLAEAILDLNTGVLTTPIGSIIEPIAVSTKSVRVNSKDLDLATQLATGIQDAASKAKVIFVECPVGSQSARAMASYGIVVGILGAIRAKGIPLIEVTAKEVKQTFTSNPNATKIDMINALIKFYPDIILPKGKLNGVGNKSEHIADATASIHAGVQTATFQTLLRIMKGNEQ